MDRLSAVSNLVINQKTEWGEILTGFETKNKYSVSDETGNSLYFAAEEAGSMLLRWFLKALRPFTIAILDDKGQVVIRVKRPFRFFFHRAEISDSQGQLLGVVEKRFSILRRVYSVSSANGEDFGLFGPILRPWTFFIKKDGVEQGKITKKWSGLLKESFTDADTFGVSLPVEWDKRLKALFLGTVFLIDFVHFENKGDN